MTNDAMFWRARTLNKSNENLEYNLNQSKNTIAEFQEENERLSHDLKRSKMDIAGLVAMKDTYRDVIERMGDPTGLLKDGSIKLKDGSVRTIIGELWAKTYDEEGIRQGFKNPELYRVH